MSTYVTAARAKYVVKDERLDEAVRFLEMFDDIKNDIHSASWGRNTSIVYPEWGNLFGGCVGNSWADDVEEFIMDFCEPESYATFRCDDWFSWVIVYKDVNGNMVVEERDCENPFEKLCNELEDEQKVLEV